MNTDEYCVTVNAQKCFKKIMQSLFHELNSVHIVQRYFSISSETHLFLVVEVT